MARTIDRIKALEAAFAPPPDVWAELRRTFWPVPMTVALLDDYDGECARWRAEAIAQGRELNADARPEMYPRSHAECEAYLMAQQARLIAAAQADVERAYAREAERIAAERKAKAPPASKPQPNSPPTFTPSIFARH